MERFRDNIGKFQPLIVTQRRNIPFQRGQDRNDK